jgi:hypothetical protein
MKYIALIYAAEVQQTPAEFEAELAEYGQFSAMLQARSITVVGEALQPAATATTVRVRDGKTLTTDGPFAETKEVLGGYYLYHAALLRRLGIYDAARTAYSTAYALCPDSKQRAYLARRMSDCA